MLITRPRRAFVHSARSGQDPTERTEAGDAVTQARADGHGVMGRAGDRAGGQINA